MKASPLKEYVNDFVRRFIENGLYDRHLEWVRQYNRDHFQVKIDTSSPALVVLSMNEMFDIFVLYFVGASLSVIVFVLEKLSVLNNDIVNINQ